MKLNSSNPNANIEEAAEKPATLTLRDPYTGEKLEDEDGGVTIAVIGAASRTAQQLRRKMFNKRMKSTDKKDPAGAAERESCQLLASLTRGWTNIEDASGPIAFSREAAVQLYTDFAWIRGQVDAFVSDLSNFGEGQLGNSPTNSSRTPSTSSQPTSEPEAAS